MSATIDITTVTNAIESLSISGVTVLDIDEIAESMQMSPATLAPRPENFITGISVTRDEMSGQALRLHYTLNYRYYHCAITGGLGGLFGSYPVMIAKIALILLAFCSDASLSGAMDNTEPSVSNIGPVHDPAGSPFHGCEFSLNIMQFLEV